MKNEALVALIEVYYDDPVAFAEDMLGFMPDGWQRDAMMALAKEPLVSVRSAQGVGKTAVEAAIVIWYLCTRPFPKVICTAPTRQQLNDVLWAEVDKWLSTSKVKKLLKWTKTKIAMVGNEERWFATARTATKPENMQGLHEDHMLFVVDEASGIDDKIMEAVLGTLSGAENKLFMCGNPTRTHGIFYDSHHRDRADYVALKVSSYDSSRTNKENVDRLIRRYGIDSDVVRVRVFGEFPKAEPDALIPLEFAEAAVHRRIYENEDGEEVIPEEALLQIGVDVARYGDDETVIQPRIGAKALAQSKWSGQDTVRTAGEALRITRELMRKYKRNFAVIAVDDTGVGGGVTDLLRAQVRENEYNIAVVACINNAKAKANDKYDSWGAESHFDLRDRFISGEIEIAENDDDLIAQITARKYHITSKGKFAVESKKEMKKRGLRSPDRGDAMVLAFANVSVDASTSKLQEIMKAIKVY